MIRRFGSGVRRGERLYNLIRVIRVIRGASQSVGVNSCNSCLKKKGPGGFTPPGAVFCIRWELSPALLGAGRKLDVAAVLQVDPERVGVVLLQVAGGHVEDPDAIAPAEGTVRDIRVSDLVHVVHRAPHRVYQCYRAVAGRKHRTRVGPDGVTVGVADGELHRNGAADLPHAATVGVDWRQDLVVRVRPGAGAIADR